MTKPRATIDVEDRERVRECVCEASGDSCGESASCASDGYADIGTG